MRRLRFCSYLCLPVLLWPLVAVAGQSVHVGVLSHRGAEATLETWGPTADYLNSAVACCTFEIVPLDFDEVEPAVQYGQVDFVLVNSGIYVNLERRFRVSRIATLNNRGGQIYHNLFGGVIFARADRDDIADLQDLRGKRFMGVDATSLGGFQMAWRELKAAGIDPYQDFASLRFGGIHDAVVMAVLEGRADAGAVRTNILEGMAAAGLIQMDDFKIINRRYHPEFFFLHSTPLYPEWPFSTLQHTPSDLARKVAVALLLMAPNDPAAIIGRYAGWTIPLDYQLVHDLFQELKLPPYAARGGFTLEQAAKRYWYWVLAGLGGVLLMALMTAWVTRLYRQAKAAKSRLERQHELILNSVADGIYGVDMQGDSTFVNRAMERLTGWTSADLIGRNQHELLHHTRPDGTPFPGCECPVYHTFRDSAPRFVADDVFWNKRGEPIPVEYTSTPIRDDRGRTVGSVVVFRDISERKQAEEEARQRQQELAHVGRLSTMGEMASGMAHELNQPLTAIATNAHACIRLLESGAAPRERVADIMERIAAQAERAGAIIRQLRQFVRKEEPQRTQVCINELVDEVVSLCRPEAKRSGVEVRLELAPGLPPVSAQPIQIEQVILNLARNAIEAMLDAECPSRRLTIATRADGPGALILSVEDSGPGIDPAIRERLFNPFVTTKQKGMGLGLSISKGIIEAHQGQLYADSEPGRGTLFRFYLPVREGGKPNGG